METIESPLKKLRTALGWSQSALAQALGCSYSSIQNYEGGKRVPREIIERLKSIAAEHDLADIALELSSEAWQVRRVFQPREVRISGAAAAVSAASQKPLDGSRSKDSGSDDREACHQILDRILDSGDRVAIAAVLQNLHALDLLIHSNQTKRRSGNQKTRPATREK
ncbi:MAG TPA: helix-turn-helix transcriptional regulator [Bryobacterales bacterium]|nr:helix-turn-helix transcriptional regulator [Bryobacterales bacterium]